MAGAIWEKRLSCGQVFAGGGKAKLDVLDALHANEPVGEALEHGRKALENGDLQAVMMAQMDVKDGEITSR